MTCPQIQTFEIFRGDQKPLPLRVILQGSLQPFDLTNCKQIHAQLPLDGGGFTDLLLTSGAVLITGASPLLGEIAINISSAISSTLNVASLQDVFAQFVITDGTDIPVSSSVTMGQLYCITNLGNTTQDQWESIGLPTTVTAAVGVVFTATVTGAGGGTGVVQALPVNSPTTVAFRECFTVYE